MSSHLPVSWHTVPGTLTVSLVRRLQGSFRMGAGPWEDQCRNGKMGRPGLCPSFCGGPDVGLTKDPMMLSTTWMSQSPSAPACEGMGLGGCQNMGRLWGLLALCPHLAPTCCSSCVLQNKPATVIPEVYEPLKQMRYVPGRGPRFAAS